MTARNHSRSWWGPLAIGIGFGLTSSLIGQLASPFHLLTHEFTQTFGAVGGVGLFFLGRSVCRRAPDRAGLAVHVTFAIGLAAGAAAFTAHAVLNAAIHQCRIGAASAFFWITWAPLAAFFAVLGVIVGERKWSGFRALALLAGVGLVCLAHDAVQVVTGAHLSDPLIGELLLLSQRATMEVTAAQLGQRIWLAGLALMLWQVRTWRAQRDPGSAMRAVVAAGILAIVTLAAGGEIGVGWSRSGIRARLDQVLRTEHFRIRYDGSGRSSLYVEAIAREAEWQWRDLTTAWEISPERAVEIRVYDSPDQMRRLTGLASSAHAGPWRINLTWWRGLTNTLRHELVHALHIEISRRPELLFLPGVVEGTAMAWSDDLVGLPEAHEQQAAALEAGHLPAAPDLMSVTGFVKVNERNAYKAAGSFIGWLVLEHGFDDFARLQRTLDFESVYGQDLRELDAGWRRFLETVPVSIDKVAVARDSFDPRNAPSYLYRTCPKLGCRDEPLEELALRKFRAGDYEGALDAYRTLYESDPRVRWLGFAATCLQWQGRHTTALDLLEQLAADGLAVDERHRLLQARIRSLVALRSWDELYEAFDALDDLGAERTVERDRVEACLKQVGLREEVAWALQREGSEEGRQRLRELAARHPEQPCVRYLAATRGLPDVRDAWAIELGWADRERIKETLNRLERIPEACDQFSERLRSVGNSSIHAGALEIAEQVAGFVARACSDPLDRHWAGRVRERVEWERSRAR